MFTKIKVGLETVSSDPQPCASPCTKVVFPAPRSPCRQTTSPVCKKPPSRIPTRRVCSGLRLKNSNVWASRIGIVKIITLIHSSLVSVDHDQVELRAAHSQWKV